MESPNIDCPALRLARNRNVSLSTSTEVADSFSFVVLADPQLGLFEKYVEKLPQPDHWDREVNHTTRAVNIINRLIPKPAFVVICGDLVNDQPGLSYRYKQTSDLLSVLSRLRSDIPLIVLPGNHDVGDHPDVNGIEDYKSVWGDDYFSFVVNRVRFLVLNTQYLWDDSKCVSLASEFRQWLNEQLSMKNEDFDMSVVFQHIPFFLDNIDEPDDYFNIPKKCRKEIIHQLYNSGIYYTFSGHLHKNNVITYTPHERDNNVKRDELPFSMISTSSVCVQLGDDQPGIRLVRINVSENRLKHVYWSLDELEKILVTGEQPEF
ncbi:unnamed protein product [Trichobilharzia szidati]|nr:unnamed protein product [Trichobilharzia szidati]